MKWKQFRLKTTTQAEDIVSSMLADLGIEGVQIEDKIPLTEQDKEQMFVDILPDGPEDDGIAYLSFFVEEAEDGTLTVNGEEKTFTTKEFDLLTFLAQNPNRVFTKEELFREIWDMESVGDIATVTVHIKKIREKIEYNNAKPQYIETIWGVGYRFKV